MIDDVTANKENFVSALRNCNREGTEALLTELENLGFFKAPASSKFHGSYEGGLCEHSLNVMKEALAIRKAQIELCNCLEPLLSEESVVVASLLHDVCKADVYKVEEKFRKDKDGKWEKYKAYGVDYSGLPVGHGEKSVIRILRTGFKLTDEEIVAIRWHMSGFDLNDSYEAKGNYGAACDKTPLVGVIEAADILAAQVLER